MGERGRRGFHTETYRRFGSRSSMDVYWHDSSEMLAAFITTDPSGQRLGYIDITNSSRKKEETRGGRVELRRAIIDKVKDQLGVKFGNTPLEAERNASKIVDHIASIAGSQLGAERKLRLIEKKVVAAGQRYEMYDDAKVDVLLDRITNALGENNILEQTQQFMLVVVPAGTAARIPANKEGLAEQERSTRYVDFLSHHVPSVLDRDERGLYLHNVDSIVGAHDSILRSSEKEFREVYESEHGPAGKDEMENLITPSARDMARSFVPMSAYTVVMLPVNAAVQRRILQGMDAIAQVEGDDAAAFVRDASRDFLAGSSMTLSRHTDSSELQRYCEGAFNDPFARLDGPIGASVLGFAAQDTSLSAASSTEGQILEEIALLSGEDPLAAIRSVSMLRRDKHDTLFRTPLNAGRIVLVVDNVSYATFRDLQRQRLADVKFEAYCDRDSNGSRARFIVPDMVAGDPGMRAAAMHGVASAVKAYNRFIGIYGATGNAEYRNAALNSLPLCIGGRMTISCSLAEMVYIIESRGNGKEAMPEYFRTAWMADDLLNAAYPDIMRGIDVKMSREPNMFSRDRSKVGRNAGANGSLE